MTQVTGLTGYAATNSQKECQILHMANPYHDELGRFCSAAEMGAAVDRVRNSGDVFTYIKLRSEYEHLLKTDSEITEDDIRNKLSPINPLADSTPVEIDTELSQIYGQIYGVEDAMSNTQKYIKDYENRLDPEYRFYRAYDDERNKEGLAKQQAILEKQEAQVASLRAQAEPFQAEYDRRPWTRAFMVLNGNGHIHRNMSCSTCYPTTRYGWLTEYSGSNEEQLVSDAGEAGCTVCYPSAPVDTRNRPSKIELPERRAAREKREAEKAERDRKAAEKGISSKDGTPLRIKSYYGVIKTARTAEIEATNLWVTTREIADKRYPRAADPEYAAQTESDLNTLVSALALKHGTSEEDQLAIIKAKGDKKYKTAWS